MGRNPPHGFSYLSFQGEDDPISPSLQGKRETLTQRKTGRLMVRVLTVISMIDRLNLFPHRGVGIVALVEKAHS
jgi:poly(3-hydroxybutyrate) depolymerase